MKTVESRKALLVGINDYAQYPLRGCENDVREMTKVLARHEKLDPNFDCRSLVNSEGVITGESLKREIENLFKEKVSIALFYFSGHGMSNEKEVYLVAADYPDEDCKVPMSWIMSLIKDSPANQVVIILDCCFAGGAGDLSTFDFPTAQLKKGVTILSATSHIGTAAERSGQGKFTQLLIRGLKGAAMDMVGHVTGASLYAYVDSFLSLWEQQPVFKTHVSQLTALRYCIPKLPKIEMRQVVDLFPSATEILPLDPSFLMGPEGCDANVKKLRVLRHLRKHGFVATCLGHTLTRTARENGTCRLTAAGLDLHQLVTKNKI